jgi:hypothetical protein
LRVTSATASLVERVSEPPLIVRGALSLSAVPAPLARTSVPALITVPPPLKVFTPVRVSVPLPAFTNGPALEPAMMPA